MNYIIRFFTVVSLLWFVSSCKDRSDSSDSTHSIASDKPKAKSPSGGASFKLNEENVSIANPYAQQALVLYNPNTSQSLELAQYYANARGLSADRLCPVKMPAGLYATWDQLLQGRKQIIEGCLCKIVNLNPCDASMVQEIAALSPISHIVLMRGLPARIQGALLDPNGYEPTLEYFLSHLLYRPESTFGEGGTTAALPSGSPQYPMEANAAEKQVNDDGFGALAQVYKQDRGYLPKPVTAQEHRQVVYGRIDGITLQSAKATIDRTLFAENNGITGNSFVAVRNENAAVVYPNFDGASIAHADAYGERFHQPGVEFLRDLRGVPRGPCTEYWYAFRKEMPYYSDTWLKHLDCKVGGYAVRSTGTPKFPGNGSLPKITNATSMYFRTVPDTAHQAAFGGVWTRMMEWYKGNSPSTCNKLCNGNAECMAASTDPFKEIDTRCIGVGRGFLGHVLRSYAVGYFGIYPPGWIARHTGDSGGTERQPPTRMVEESGSTSNVYLRFAPDDAVDTPRCPTAAAPGGAECLASVPFAMTHTQALATPIVLNNSSTGPYKFQLKYRYHGKYTKSRIRVRIRFDNDANFKSSLFADTYVSPIVKPLTGNTWQTLEIPASVTGTGTITHVHFILWSGFADRLEHRFDLDDVAFLDPAGNDVITPGIGTFDAPYVNNLTEGDWAANMIDRLGGIAWWGSSSHYEANGSVFGLSNLHMQTFYAGRSLGESLYTTGYGNKQLASGLIYGDPAYSPAAVRLHLGEGDEALPYRANSALDPDYKYSYTNPIGIPITLRFRNAYHTINGSDPATYQRPLYINAINGRQKDLVWTIYKCEGAMTVSSRTCTESNLWQIYRTGAHQQWNGEVVDNLLAFVGDRTTEHHVYLKLKVAYPGQGDVDALYSYAYFKFEP